MWQSLGAVLKNRAFGSNNAIIGKKIESFLKNEFLAEYNQPDDFKVSFKNNILIVKARDPYFKNEILLNQKKILEEISKKFKDIKIDKIKFF
jgi:hypothetical protein